MLLLMLNLMLIIRWPHDSQHVLPTLAVLGERTKDLTGLERSSGCSRDDSGWVVIRSSLVMAEPENTSLSILGWPIHRQSCSLETRSEGFTQSMAVTTRESTSWAREARIVLKGYVSEPYNCTENTATSLTHSTIRISLAGDVENMATIDIYLRQLNIYGYQTVTTDRQWVSPASTARPVKLRVHPAFVRSTPCSRFWKLRCFTLQNLLSPTVMRCALYPFQFTC